MANSEMKPRFSIIVPLYNKAPYVRKALESIFAQTFTAYELIIVDDGSTDNSAAICEDFISNLKLETVNPKLENIRIISQPNSGVAKARNVGVENSHGEYVCFLDADDWWDPAYLEELDKLTTEYPDAGIYCTNYVYYKPGKTRVALNIERGYMNYPEAYLQSVAMPIWTGAASMPRRVFDEMGGFPNGVKLGEDFLLWAKTALHYKIAFSEKPLAYYNNDVPASLRATRNLHAPEHNMIFEMDDIEQMALGGQYPETWKALLDKLRINGLIEYWLSDMYQEVAVVELKKVDWSKQPKSVKTQYEKPIWFIKTKRRMRQIGSIIKQNLIRVLCR